MGTSHLLTKQARISRIMFKLVIVSAVLVNLGYGQNWESLVDEFPKVKDILTDDVTEEALQAAINDCFVASDKISCMTEKVGKEFLTKNKDVLAEIKESLESEINSIEN